jgi:hypothetical protein
MAAESFNTLGGFSVGIPAISVVDSAGNVITNVNSPTGNVTANTMFANTYRYANGAILSTIPGGSDTQLQFNNNGALDGIPNVTWNGNILSLGNVNAVSINGGENGYFLQTDGSGNLTWSPGNGGNGGNGNPGGANSQVQFNDAGVFGGDAGFTYNKTTDTLAVNNLSIPQIITPLIVSNNITGSANLTALTVSGNVQFSSVVNLGPISNVKIAGGIPGYVMTTNGSGVLSWQPQTGGGGGNGTPGGSNTQVQYNSNGEFAGSAFFSFNDVSNTVQVGGLLIANTVQVGSGAYKFGTSAVFFAVTASSVKQVLYSIPVSEISGVDFSIIGTDSIGQKRQSLNISSLYYAGVVQYNEYSGLNVNGGIGDFVVEYNPGDIINPPSLDLSVTPDNSNQTIYKMLITILAP